MPLLFSWFSSLGMTSRNCFSKGPILGCDEACLIWLTRIIASVSFISTRLDFQLYEWWWSLLWLWLSLLWIARVNCWPFVIACDRCQRVYGRGSSFGIWGWEFGRSFVGEDTRYEDWLGYLNNGVKDKVKKVRKYETDSGIHVDCGKSFESDCTILDKIM